MKFKGDVVRPPEVEPEVAEVWEAPGGVEGLRAGVTPFVEMGEASRTGFRGMLVS